MDVFAGVMNPKKVAFAIVPWAKRFLVAFFIGILITQPIAQLVIVAVVLLGCVASSIVWS